MAPAEAGRSVAAQVALQLLAERRVVVEAPDELHCTFALPLRQSSERLGCTAGQFGHGSDHVPSDLVESNEFAGGELGFALRDGRHGVLVAQDVHGLHQRLVFVAREDDGHRSSVLGDDALRAGAVDLVDDLAEVVADVSQRRGRRDLLKSWRHSATVQNSVQISQPILGRRLQRVRQERRWRHWIDPSR